MKYKCIVEYDYPVDHKPPFEAILYLHGDSVQADRIKPFYDEEWVPREKYDRLLENSMFLNKALKKYQEYEEEIVRCKDCRFYHPTYCEMWSKFGTIMTAENGFCYWGKEKECQH